MISAVSVFSYMSRALVGFESLSKHLVGLYNDDKCLRVNLLYNLTDSVHFFIVACTEYNISLNMGIASLCL